MPKIETLVQKITILGNHDHIPKVLFTALPAVKIEDMKPNLDKLNEVITTNRRMKNLKFYVEWDD